MNSGSAFWTVNSVPRAFTEKAASKCLLGDLAEAALLARPGTCPQHVDRALFLLDRLEQAVQIGEVGRIGLHAGHVPADLLDGFVQRVLASARDEDVGSFVYEQLGAGQRHTTCRACDHRDLAIELSHKHSIRFDRSDVMYTDLSA